MEFSEALEAARKRLLQIYEHGDTPALGKLADGINAQIDQLGAEKSKQYVADHILELTVLVGAISNTAEDNPQLKVMLLTDAFTRAFLLGVAAGMKDGIPESFRDAFKE